MTVAVNDVTASISQLREDVVVTWFLDVRYELGLD